MSMPSIISLMSGRCVAKAYSRHAKCDVVVSPPGLQCLITRLDNDSCFTRPSMLALSPKRHRSSIKILSLGMQSQLTSMVASTRCSLSQEPSIKVTRSVSLLRLLVTCTLTALAIDSTCKDLSWLVQLRLEKMPVVHGPLYPILSSDRLFRSEKLAGKRADLR